jgi:hypothetical protein
MAQRIPSGVTVAETVAYIISAAGRPQGVTVAEVAEFCGVTDSPARNRIATACSEHPGVLIKAERNLGFRRIDVRWFIHQAHADAFRDGRTHDCAAPRTPVTTVQLPTQASATVPRAGALDFTAHGSRRGNWIYHRDGSRTPVVDSTTTQQDTTHA